MSYSKFSFAQVVELFNLTVTEGAGLFENVPASEISNYLQETLNFNVPLALAVNSEKARSEFIIAPVMLELKKLTNYALFSGVEFNVDESKGLNGYVDFLMSQDPEQIFVKAPVVVIIEAKRDDLAFGLGQCAATLVGAQQFNQDQNREDIELLGAVTTGTVWRFLKLTGNNLQIDLQEYSIREIDKILGILQI
ncbi:MAG: hypothetical protein F6K14_07770 [Symploca sp. SIO2C1]|nr:hypothetical protein [Symploca sp. SIO2C1]